MSTEVAIQDEDSFKQAMADVRSDENSTTWALFGHWDGNPNVICLVGTGCGGPEEMLDSISDEQYMYGLVRLEETFDMSTTVKFVYIRWSGPNVAFTKKGKYGVVHGSIEKYFSPYHLSHEVDSRDELTEEHIRTKLQETSGTKNKVLEASDAKSRPERGFTSGTTSKMDTFTGTTPTSGAKLGKIGKAGSSFTGMARGAQKGVKVDDSVYEAIADVRNEATETNWCACQYEGNNPRNPLVVMESGPGTAEDFRTLVTDDNIVYGLIKVIDLVDEIPTIKFAYVQWMGEGCKPMSKAKVSTNKGALEEIFKPYHVSIFATSIGEISSRVINDKVASASGSKSNVKK